MIRNLFGFSIKHPWTGGRFLRLAGIMLLMGLAPAAGAGSAGKTPAVVLDADPAARVAGSGLQPGLAVHYYSNVFVRHIDGLVARAKGDAGRPGAPITRLNHQFARNPVFASGSSRGVGLRLEGYLHFSQTGAYQLQALANDGIRILLGDRLLLEDPGVHGDRLSPVGAVVVMRPGWYPVTIWYFQRKGTAALKLFWRPPGADAHDAVPAAALAHNPARVE